MDQPCVILQGKPGSIKRVDLSSTATMYSHMTAATLRNLLNASEYVICRAGYTGIMDLALLKKKALIVPTPGQTEQEYLAEYLAARGLFLARRQEELDLVLALDALRDFEPIFHLPAKDLLGEEIRESI
jgi:UDP-N-acetylglucosamine:LPS N-acetylglucosamine transferase